MEKLKNGHYHVFDVDGTEAGKYRTFTSAKKLANGKDGRYVALEDGQVVYRNGNEAVSGKEGESIIKADESEPIEAETRVDTASATETSATADDPSAETVTDNQPKSAQRSVVLNRLMNIRKGPGKVYPITTTKKAGTVLPVIEVMDNGWLRVLFDGEEAYVLYNNGTYGRLI